MIPLADTQGSGKFPFWTVMIIFINCFVFYLEYTNPNPDGFMTRYALIPLHINFQNFITLYPFITSQFLHAGFLHLISNMWFLWIFGGNTENRLGIFFPLIYLVAGITGNLGQYFVLSNSAVPMIGASGAVAGILGVYFTFFSKHTIKTIVPIFGFFTIADLPTSLILVYWFVTQIFAGSASLVNSSYQLGGVAYFAHIAGFTFGLIISKIINHFSPPTLEQIKEKPTSL